MYTTHTSRYYKKIFLTCITTACFNAYAWSWVDHVNVGRTSTKNAIIYTSILFWFWQEMKEKSEHFTECVYTEEKV